MTTRHFTQVQLAALGIPPDHPDDVTYSEHLLADEHVTNQKYTQQRRTIFRADDGRTYAVKYETELDTGDYEVGGGMPDNHGWWGDSVEAVEVVQRATVVMTWVPVAEDPAP